MNKNWFFIIMLSLAALSLAGTAAYFSVFGLSKLFYAAGLGITILAASLEFAKLVTVSYVYRFWNQIKKGIRGFYVFAVVFIMFLTSIGIYGFLTGAYQQTANRMEFRDSQIQIAENKKQVFTTRLENVNNSIQSSYDRLNVLAGLRVQQERRIDTLYNRNMVTTARRTEDLISGANEQINSLNEDITNKTLEIGQINDSIAFYDNKIMELKTSEISNEIGPYKFVADLTGVPINNVVNIVALLIILVFDPLAIALLIGVNQLTLIEKKDDEDMIENKKSDFLGFFKDKFFKKKVKEVETITLNDTTTSQFNNVDKSVTDLPTTTLYNDIYKSEEKIDNYNDTDVKKVTSVRGRVNSAYFTPNK